MTASFSPIDCAAQGYKLVWTERQYLLRLALVPLLIKLVCQTIILVNGWETMFIRQALVLLPSYFADGWMLAHLTRLVFLGQRWPFRPSGNTEQDMAVMQDRAQGIMAGTVCYVLIKLVLAGLLAFVYGSGAVADPSLPPPATTQPPSLPVALAAMAALVLTIWSFRYVFLYIPAAAGGSMRSYLKAVGGMMGSVRLMAAAIMCYMPVMLLFAILASLILSPYAQGSVPVFAEFVLNIAKSATEILMALVVTAGISFGVLSLFGVEKKQA